MAPVALGRVDRRLEQQLPHDLQRIPADRRRRRDKPRHPCCEKWAKLAWVLADIVREDEVIVVPSGQNRSLAGSTSRPNRRSSKSRDDARVQDAHHVGEDRGAKAGRELLRDRSAAEDVAALQHQHFEPRLGEIAAANQAVVPAADDDRVVAARHHVTLLELPLPGDCAKPARPGNGRTRSAATRDMLGFTGVAVRVKGRPRDRLRAPRHGIIGRNRRGLNELEEIHRRSDRTFWLVLGGCGSAVWPRPFLKSASACSACRWPSA